MLELIKSGELVAFDAAPSGSNRRTWRITRESLQYFREARTHQKPANRKRQTTKKPGGPKKFFPEN